MARMTASQRNRRAARPVTRAVPAERTGVIGIPLTSPTALPKNTGVGPRHGKCPQKIGMWGTLSTDYKTPGMTTHDSRWSQTVQNRAV